LAQGVQILAGTRALPSDAVMRCGFAPLLLVGLRLAGSEGGLRADLSSEPGPGNSSNEAADATWSLGEAHGNATPIHLEAANPNEAPVLLGDVNGVLESLQAAAAELTGNLSTLSASSSSDELDQDELDAQAEWQHQRRRRRRRRRHAPSPNLKTLYHTTSPAVAELILASGFKPGHAGWCGGAIYFVPTPELPETKFGPYTLSGAVIEAKVNLGRVANMDARCKATFGQGIRDAVRHGYDSVRFDPGDGDEYVIVSARRVVSMRRYE